MCLTRNKQKLKYALQNTEIPVYQTDEDGNTKEVNLNIVTTDFRDKGTYQSSFTVSVEKELMENFEEENIIKE